VTKITSLGYTFKEVDGKYQLCLGEIKKEGFSKGFYNGFGGKVGDKIKDETVESGLVREAMEEFSITLREFSKKAIVNFYSQDKTNPDVTTHVFFVKSWLGSPSESEEIKPEWFDLDKIPYDKMWASDKYWLSDILKLSFDDYFKKSDIMIYDILSDPKDWNMVISVKRYGTDHNNVMEIPLSN